MIRIPYLYTMEGKLAEIQSRYNYIIDFSDSISRIIKGTQSSSDYITIYSHYLTLEPEDTKELDSIVGEKIGYILA